MEDFGKSDDRVYERAMAFLSGIHDTIKESI